MLIENTKNGRGYLAAIRDIETVGKKNKPKGFNRHCAIVGFFLSCMGLAFKDENAGWVNKKSFVHYLKRNNSSFDIIDATHLLIEDLHESSSIEDVNNLFNLIKDSKIKPSHFPISLKTPKRYLLAEELNPESAITLTDGHTAYPAYHVQFFPDSYRFIIAESPKGSPNVVSSGEVLPHDDNKYYYEMAWKTKPSILISAVSVFKERSSDLDKDNYNFLGERKEKEQFTMTNGAKLMVKCSRTFLDDVGVGRSCLVQTRKLKLTSGDIKNNIDQWIVKRGFGYTTSNGKVNDHGIELAKDLYEKYIKGHPAKEVAMIVNCDASSEIQKHKSYALILWIQIFQLLDKKQIKPEDITYEYLVSLVEKCEFGQDALLQSINIINDTYAPIYIRIPEVIHSILDTWERDN